MRTRLKTTPIRVLAAPSIQRDARGGHETYKIVVLRHAASTVSNPRMEVSVYMSLFWYWLNDRLFLHIALKDARPYVLIQNLGHRTAVGAWARQRFMRNRRNWQ